MFDTVKLMREFASISSVSGAETPLSGRIAELVTPLADEVFTDKLGNLIVRKKGRGQKIMLSAHADTIGMMATHIDDKGFIRFANIGGLCPLDIAGAPVVFQNGARGLVAYEDKVELKDLKINNCYIDIGADSKEEAAGLVSVGERARYAGQPFETSGKLVSPYMDDRIGCVILMQALQQCTAVENDLYFVFSVQEEVGLRGARTAAFAIEPDWALAVDVTDTGDYLEPKNKSEVRLGGGAAIKLFDRSLVCHPAVTKHLEHCARERGIAHQFEVLTAGGTDAGAIHLTRGGVPSGGVSVPTRYIHSPVEMVQLSDVAHCTALVVSAVSRPLAFA